MTQQQNFQEWGYAQRRKHAAQMRALAPSVARAVTDEFFRRYPSWLEAYGLVGVERGVEDARFHVEFLAGAVEAGNPDAFADYTAWAARVLSSRSIRTNFLIENIEQVRDALAEQLEPEGAAVVRQIVQHAFNEFDAGKGRHADVINAAVNVYVSATLSSQRSAALNIAREALEEGASVIDVYCDLLLPAQYEIGRLWETNEISVAQEHMATAITQYVVSQISNELPRPEVERGNIVVTGVEGELHQLGVQMLADALTSDGWNVRFLGSQVPLKDLVSFVSQHETDVLALSVSMLFNVQKAAQLIEGVRRKHKDTIRIVVGGRAFRTDKRLWREIGADGSAPDLRAGLALLRRMVN